MAARPDLCGVGPFPRGPEGADLLAINWPDERDLRTGLRPTAQCDRRARSARS